MVVFLLLAFSIVLPCCPQHYQNNPVIHSSVATHRPNTHTHTHTHTQTNREWERTGEEEQDIKFQDRKDISPTVHPSTQNTFSSFLIIKAVNLLQEGGRTQHTNTTSSEVQRAFRPQRLMLDVLSPLHFLGVNLSADMCVILSFHMCFISGILSVTLGPLRRYPESPNLCHNNTTRTTTPSVVFAQLVRLCQSVSNSLFLPFYCYSLPLFSFFALSWFVGSFVLCFASKGTSPMYPVCSLGQW